MQFKTLKAALFTGAIIMAGCNSDKGTGPGNIDPANIVGSWMVTGATLNPGVDMGNGVIVTDFLDYIFEACEQDDLLTFNANGTYSNSEGATSCNPPSNTESGTWTMTGNILVQTATGGSPDTTVFATLTATTATISEAVPPGEFGDNIARTMTITATKQ